MHKLTFAIKHSSPDMMFSSRSLFGESSMSFSPASCLATHHATLPVTGFALRVLQSKQQGTQQEIPLSASPSNAVLIFVEPPQRAV